MDEKTRKKEQGGDKPCFDFVSEYYKALEEDIKDE